MKKGAEVELTIESLAYKGKGVGHLDGLAVFVPNTAPGDRIRAQITKKKKRFREAKLLEVLSPSDLRVEPPCRHAAVCGGCSWQHVPYEEQLRQKEQQVRDHMERLGGLNPDLVQSILGCEQSLGYRNKMEYSFGPRRWLTREEIDQDEFVSDRQFSAGLHAPGRFDKILNLQECHLQPPFSYEILDTVRSWCLENDIEAFDPVKQTGSMRHLVVRHSVADDEVMVVLVTRDEIRPEMARLSELLTGTFPIISTVVHQINPHSSPTADGQTFETLHGKGLIEEQLGDYRFTIGPDAFFQTNSRQAVRLYDKVLDYVSREPCDHLFDLYCGVGTLTLYLSGQVREAVGIELVETAIHNANENAARNDVQNVRFVQGDMKDTFSESLLQETGRPDLIVTDPPRAGMHPDVVQQLKELSAPRMVYVSCNPSTLARDLKEMSDVYEVVEVTPVDMFPQTWHIEAVAYLKRRTAP
ncbi:MAG: 23S rRNA (uracil(1939)-C(5))-methyltransferase RlmD [Bacteroidota bacterium]